MSNKDEHPCPSCEESFTTRSGLGKHHSHAHGESITEYERRITDADPCPTCGREFKTERGMKVHHKQEHGETIRREQVSVVCEYCTEVFSVYPCRGDEVRFCSKECLAGWQSENVVGESHHQYDSVSKECVVCESEFEVVQSKSDREFCSESCYGEWRTKNLVGDEHPLYRRVTLTCENCGGEYEVKPHKKDHSKFCSRECKQEMYVGQNHPQWNGGGGIRWDVTRLLGDVSWPKKAEGVRSDANRKCEMCGDGSGSIPHSLDVHHIIPVLSGGCNSDELLMALCRRCHGKAEQHIRQITDTVLADWTDDELPDGRSRHRDDPDATELQPTLSAFAE